MPVPIKASVIALGRCPLSRNFPEPLRRRRSRPVVQMHDQPLAAGSSPNRPTGRSRNLSHGGSSSSIAAIV